MRLQMFRERLLREVQEAGELSKEDQTIQPYMCCIASLLRKIMTRTGFASTIKVKAYERDHAGKTRPPRRESVGMVSLTNKILHYREFLPAVDWATLDHTRRMCTILSDKEGRIFRRLVDIDEFLRVAMRIASDDEAMLAPLLRSARTRLGAIVHRRGLSNGNERAEIEAMESLIDVFDLARAMNKDSLERW